MPDRTCSVADCDRKVSCRGWCKKHYERWQRHGDPLVVIPASQRRTRPLADRFWPKVDKTDDCWLWTGALNSTGYGYIARTSNRMVPAHRIAYELLVGPIPDGLTLDHLCRVRNCVNPSHLEPVTMRENTLRGSAPPAINARRTHCVNGHEFTPENTYVGTTGRECRACNRLRARERYWAKKGRA